jgi:hygromycin-B 7''-O-kinase
MFSGSGDSRLIGALFRGYFGDGPPPGETTSKRLLALALLHRYANFDLQLRIPGWRDRVDSLDALAELVWPRNASFGGPRRRGS